MVRVEDAVIARYEAKGEKFELLVDPDLAMDLKKGREVSFADLLAIDTVFKDAKKGEEKSEERISEEFGTTDVEAVAKRIILEGEVQLTTDQRRKIAEQRRKEVVEFISKNALNPQTKGPHPVQRIENALAEAKVHVDFNKSAQEQVPAIIDAIRKLIPISLEKLRVAVKVPAQYSGAASAILHKYRIEKEQWMNDGSLIAVLELPAGMKADLFNELNNLTHGAVETRIV